MAPAVSSLPTGTPFQQMHQLLSFLKALGNFSPSLIGSRVHTQRTHWSPLAVHWIPFLSVIPALPLGIEGGISHSKYRLLGENVHWLEEAAVHYASMTSSSHDCHPDFLFKFYLLWLCVCCVSVCVYIICLWYKHLDFGLLPHWCIF